MSQLLGHGLALTCGGGTANRLSPQSDILDTNMHATAFAGGATPR